MVYLLFLIVGIGLGFSFGYVACYIDQKRSSGKKEQEDMMITVKRSKPSLRSPLQTNRVSYEQYKTHDTGLYAPVKPKSKRNDELEVTR